MFREIHNANTINTKVIPPFAQTVFIKHSCVCFQIAFVNFCSLRARVNTRAATALASIVLASSVERAKTLLAAKTQLITHRLSLRVLEIEVDANKGIVIE